MRVTLTLDLDITDVDAVIAAGDRCIREGWGVQSIRAYLGESDDAPLAIGPVLTQAVWEVVLFGMWETLAGSRDAVELVDGGCRETVCGWVA